MYSTKRKYTQICRISRSRSMDPGQDGFKCDCVKEGVKPCQYADLLLPLTW